MLCLIPMDRQHQTEALRAVLDTLIAVEEQRSWLGSSCVESVAQRRGHEARIDPIRHVVPNDDASMQIQHDRHVPGFRVATDLFDVTDPHAVGRCDVELSFQHVA